VVHEKNPNRVAGQLRLMIRSRRKELKWVPLFWVLPLGGLVVCWHTDANVWVWFILLLTFFSGCIQHFADFNQYCDWKKRLNKLESAGEQLTSRSS